MSIDAMKQALEALELLARYENPETKIQVRKPRDGGPIVTMYPHKVASEAAAALRAAIEQAQEPVAWADMDVHGEDKGLSWTPGHFHKTPLYTAPPQRKPLTPREVELLDGMIEVQLRHAAQCDGIANRTMAEKQKSWDMERVELLRKLKSAHGIKGGRMTDRELMQQALHTLEGWANHGKWVWPESALEQAKRNTTESIAALSERLSQPEQEPVAWVYPEGLEALKSGRPWTAYGSNGDGRIPLYLNDAVAQKVEPPAAESGAGFESLPASSNQPEQGQDMHEDWCASLTQLLLSMPPKPAPCNCKLKTARRDSRQWQGLTDEELREAYIAIRGNEWCLGGMSNAESFYEAIEAKLREKNT